MRESEHKGVSRPPLTAKVGQDAAYQSDLIALIPYMRGFAHSLCRDPIEADDIAQEALASAWAHRSSFALGTNLKAWVFRIVRNRFYTTRRSDRRLAPLDSERMEQTPGVPENPTAMLELDEVRRALARLPNDQREALVLIGAGGLSYEEAREICGVPIGTIKSRVSRARDNLALIFAEADFATDDIPVSHAMEAILAESAALQRGARIV